MRRRGTGAAGNVPGRAGPADSVPPAPGTSCARAPGRVPTAPLAIRPPGSPGARARPAGSAGGPRSPSPGPPPAARGARSPRPRPGGRGRRQRAGPAPREERRPPRPRSPTDAWRSSRRVRPPPRPRRAGRRAGPSCAAPRRARPPGSRSEVRHRRARANAGSTLSWACASRRLRPRATPAERPCPGATGGPPPTRPPRRGDLGNPWGRRGPVTARGRTAGRAAPPPPRPRRGPRSVRPGSGGRRCR